MAAVLADAERFARAEREFTISDGTVVQGWLIRDPARSGPQPLLLDIHGGPHNAWHGAADPVHLYHQELAARGWTILLLNPRGSDGYGERFYTAAQAGWVRRTARTSWSRSTRSSRRASRIRTLAGGDRVQLRRLHDLLPHQPGPPVRGRGPPAAIAGHAAQHGGHCPTPAHYLSELEFGGQPWAGPDRYPAMSPLAQVNKRAHADARRARRVQCAPPDSGRPSSGAHGAGLRELGVPTRLVLYPGTRRTC